MGELGAAIGQCSSILSLKIVVKRGFGARVQSFFRGASELRFLTRLEIDLGEGTYVSAEVIDGIESLAVQQGNLAHFSLLTTGCPEGCIEESWKGLGLALCSVKSVRLRIHPQEAVLAVLAHLQSCETLELSTYYSQAWGEVATGLSNLRIVSIGDNHASVAFRDNVLTMIKSINSIATVRLNRGSAALRDRIESFCILNRVFSTNLVTFGPTDLWTRVLSKVSDTSARATLIHRLLCEKPELCMKSILLLEHQGWKSDEEPVGAA